MTHLPLVERLQHHGRQIVLSPAMLLWLVLALALALRLHGLNWDQGYGFHPDERSIYMRAGCMYDVLALRPGYETCLVDYPKTQPGPPSLTVLLDPQRSPLNPHWFPLGSILVYVLVFARSIIELFADVGALDMRYVGRPLSALADVGSVFLVYLLGRRMYGQGVGLLAAAFTALAVIHIQNSHFYRPETFSAFFTLAAFWAMLRMVRRRGWRDSALLGLLAGLALAPKLNALPLLLPLGLAYLYRLLDSAAAARPAPALRAAGQTLAHASLAAVVAVVAFLATSPYALLDFRTFVADQLVQANMARHAGLWPFTVQYVGTLPFLYQMRQSIAWGLGIPLGVVAWASIPFTAALALRRPATRRSDLLLLAWVVPSLLLLESFQVRFLRYLFPLMPFMLLMGARMLLWLVDGSRSWANPPVQVPASAPLLLGRGKPPTPPYQGGGTEGVVCAQQRGATPPNLPLVRGGNWNTPSKRWWRNCLSVARLRVRPCLPWLVTALVALVVAATAFYALAFQRIYSREHPAVAASRWINANLPADTTIISDNHWDEFIPDLHRYQVWQFPVYDPDTPDKMAALAQNLAGAEYLVFYSHRPYVSVARSPQRFPLSLSYYRQLFGGDLGYRLERRFTSYPQLLGVAFQDNPFPTAGLPPPVPLTPPDEAPSLALDLGYADDNVVGYDHPLVLVFRNTRHLPLAELSQRLAASGAAAAPRPGLMLSEEQKAVQRRGGAWSEIVHRDSWANRLPVLAWLLAVEVIYLVTLPLALFIFRPLPDRGIVLARILGLLAVSYVAWLSVSLGWVPFSRSAILLGVLAVAAVSAAVLAAAWREIMTFLAARWRLLLLGETLFLAAFLAFVALRAANPDLWHPFRGGEKPMELAYLNAVVRSTIMPPYDPWFAGGYLNYYYWGYFVVAVLVRITGIIPTTAFNLAVPLFFALTFTGACSLVYNLAEGMRRSGEIHPERSPVGGEEIPPGPPLQRGVGAGLEGSAREGISSSVRTPVAAGLLAGLFVAVIGNLDGLIQLVRGAWQTAVQSQGFPAFDFWRSSRVVPSLDSFNPSPLAFWVPDRAQAAAEVSPHITEFPFFTFLFADLHAHLMAIPFTLLVAALGLALATGLSRGRLPWMVAAIVVLGVALGALAAINSWDYPSYLALSVLLLGGAAWSWPGKVSTRLILWCALSAGVVALSLVAFYPFHQSYQTFDTGIAASRWRTPLDQYLSIHGLFLFIAATFLLYHFRDGLGRARKTRNLPPSPAGKRGLEGFLSRLKRRNVTELLTIHPWPAALSTLGLLAVIFFLLTGYWTAALLLALLLLTTRAAWRVMAGSDPAPSKQSRQFQVVPLIFLGLALSIGIGLDLVRLQGDIGRMNTLFKYYLEAWVLFAIAAAALLAHLGTGGFFRRSWATGLWVGLLALLLGGSLVYTVLGARARLADRFAPTPLTLDGTAYMAGAAHQEAGRPISLKWDLEAIQWLQDNVSGSPVVLEAHHEQYHWTGRISSYTGLPTVLGWPWHQIQQRTPYESEVRARAAAVAEIYNTLDTRQAEALLRQYEVRYVVVGEVEQAYYADQGLAKFETMAGSGLITLVFQNPGVKIYQTAW